MAASTAVIFPGQGSQEVGMGRDLFETSPVARATIEEADEALGFALSAVAWTTLDNIGDQQLKIGTVLGYANTDDFDAKVETGSILAIPSNDDLTNLKKLLRQRIDAVVIDKLVLEYWKATEASHAVRGRSGSARSATSIPPRTSVPR